MSRQARSGAICLLHIDIVLERAMNAGRDDVELDDIETENSRYGKECAEGLKAHTSQRKRCRDGSASPSESRLGPSVSSSSGTGHGDIAPRNRTTQPAWVQFQGVVQLQALKLQMVASYY